MHTVSEVIAMANDPNVHFKTFEAAASEVLGEGNTPAKKADILAALKALQGDVPSASDDESDYREVVTTRKYAPLNKDGGVSGVYYVLAGGEYERYEQVSDGINLTVPAGSTIRVSKTEASRMIRNKIAEITDRTL